MAFSELTIQLSVDSITRLSRAALKHWQLLSVKLVLPSSTRQRMSFSECPVQHQQKFMTLLIIAVAHLPDLAALEGYVRNYFSDLDDKK